MMVHLERLDPYLGATWNGQHWGGGRVTCASASGCNETPTFCMVPET
jgi:hypothetical protein